jgi:hypothetical protein
MRVLEFIVEGQKLIKNPSCDFENLVPGTEGYLRAHFSFSPDWNDCVLIARFFRGKDEYARQIVNNTCDIPPEVLKGRVFSISVLGQRAQYRITTNRILIVQEVSR